MPAFVQLPARLYFDPGLYFLGQSAGWLGTKYDPILIQQDPNSPAFRVDEFAGAHHCKVPTLSLTFNRAAAVNFRDIEE